MTDLAGTASLLVLGVAVTPAIVKAMLIGCTLTTAAAMQLFMRRWKHVSGDAVGTGMLTHQKGFQPISR